MSDEPADGQRTDDGGVVVESRGRLGALLGRKRSDELTVVGLTALAVVVFPWLFVRAPVVSSLLDGYQGLAALILIWGIFAIGFDLLLGYTGLLSFGHAAFWGGAAYAAGIFSANVYGGPIPVVVAGTLFAVLLAWVLGYLSLRRGGIYFAILTLAFAQMFFYLSSSPLAFLTNGENGFTGVRIEPLLGAVHLESSLPGVFGYLLGDWLYVFVGLIAVVAVATAHRILNSPYGLIFQAIRENEQRVEFVGLNVWRYKLMSFVISGAFAGVAGSLYTIHAQYVPLESLYWTTSGEVVIMTVLGGAGSLFGPMLGAALYLYVENIVSGFDVIGTFWHLILGVVFVIVIALFPRGIWGILEDLWGILEDLWWFATLFARDPRAAFDHLVAKIRLLLGRFRAFFAWLLSIPRRLAALVTGGGH